MYQIKDWDKHFENAESRKYKHPRWVPMPNKHDGKGYRRMAKHERAVELMCAWSLILQVASKCPARGVLADEDGALSAEDLADMTGFPESIFTLAFQVLTTEKIGWIEEISRDAVRIPQNLPASPEVPAESPSVSGETPAELKGKEKERKEDLPTPHLRAAISAYSPEVTAVLAAYPKKREREGGRVENVHVGEGDRGKIVEFVHAYPDYPLLDAVKFYAKSTKRPKDLRTWLQNPTDTETVRKAKEASNPKPPSEAAAEDVGPVVTAEEATRETTRALAIINGKNHPMVKERMAAHG